MSAAPSAVLPKVKQEYGGTSPQVYARIAGLLYLIVIITGGFAQIFVRQPLIVHSDAAATARNILASESLWRLGLAADLVCIIATIAMTSLFYILFKPVSRNFVLLAVFYAMAANTAGLVNSVNLLAPLVLLRGAHHWTALNTGQVQDLALVFIRLHEWGFNIGLASFGPWFLLIGYVIFKSTFLPRTLGVLYVIAGLCYMTNTVALYLLPGLAKLLVPAILLPCLLGEASLCLWLLVMGVNVSKWHKRAAAARVT